MPSGLLQGKGCYDSVLPAEDGSNLFQSIRHHNTSFILEQRRALEKQENLKKEQESNLEQEMKDWIANGALPIVRKCVRFLFLLTLFPFYFALFMLPSLLLAKVVKPVVKMVISYIIQPVVNAFSRFVYRPVAYVYGKIRAAIRIGIDLLMRPYVALRSFVGKVMFKVYQFAVAPPLRVVKYVRRMVLKGIKAFAYGTRASYVCGRLLARHGLNHICSYKKSGQ